MRNHFTFKSAHPWATLKLQLRYIGAQTRVTADIRDRSGAGNLGVIQAVRRHHFSLDSHRFRTFIYWGCRTYGGDFLLAQIDQLIQKLESDDIFQFPAQIHQAQWITRQLAQLGCPPWLPALTGVQCLWSWAHLCVRPHRPYTFRAGRSHIGELCHCSTTCHCGGTQSSDNLFWRPIASIWKPLKWHYVPRVTMPLMSPEDVQRQGRWWPSIITGGEFWSMLGSTPDDKLENTIIFPSPHGWCHW